MGSTASSLRESQLLVIGVLLVVAACAILTAYAALMVTMLWDPVSVLCGLVAIGAACMIAYHQLKSLRKSSIDSTFQSSIAPGLLGSVAIFLAATHAQRESDGVHDRRWEVIALGVGVMLWLGAVLNILWLRSCRGRNNKVGTARRLVHAKWDLKIIVPIIIFVVASISVQVVFGVRRIGEGVGRSAAPFGLPASATDINFIQGPRGSLTCDFFIEKEQFIQWIRNGIGVPQRFSAGVVLREIVSPCKIRRVCKAAERDTALGYGMGSWCEAEVLDGYSYEWRERDRNVSAVFDRAAARAYYYRQLY
ncbi:hypothetical protein [Schlesneria sp. T3-172]|uniref:hypothetical protein n=1 Tax=Schlesneria sphaerica TaxID=3373610 RepID=UPI0037C5A537